jgi:uncharacterized membrane protein
MLMLVVSLLLVYVALEHVKPKFLKVVCIAAGAYESFLLLAHLALRLSHN